jgi:hypothetical protein
VILRLAKYVNVIAATAIAGDVYIYAILVLVLDCESWVQIVIQSTVVAILANPL